MINAPPIAGAENARSLAVELKRRWRRGTAPDAAAALAEYPDLARHKSIVVDLAYEEYLLLEEAGAAPEPGPFADRFPAFRGSVRNMIEAHCLLVERPELLDPPVGPWPVTEDRFEGLDVLVELGRGTFGRAYLAFDPATDRLCVLKLTTGRSVEARVIGRLVHLHVIDVYWARAVEGRTAVCMPFVGVSTLADVISAAFPRPGASPVSARVILDAAEADGLAGQADRRSAPVVRSEEPYLVGACAVAARVADAVAYLHTEGVVHGDIKPSNVVVGPGGAPHLIDFNLSTGGGTGSMIVGGTPAYMAPELFAAAAGGKTTTGIDAVRADLYSLAVVVIELFTGARPSPPEGSDADKALALPAGLSSAVGAVLASCLAPDPNLRSTSAFALAAALDRFVCDHRHHGQRYRRWVVAAISLAALGLSVAGVRAWSLPPRTELPAPLVERPPESAEAFLSRGRALLRAGDVNAARADFIAAYDRSGDPHTLALVAYCLALGGQSAPSIDVSRRAIKEGGMSAEAYNNLGYALSQSPRPAEAIPELDEALRLSPRLQAALYNRAIARYRVALIAGLPQDRRAAEDITAALEGATPAAGLHFDAARIYAACSIREPAFRAAACEQIRAAIRAGKDPASCRNDAILASHLDGDPAFEAACATPRGEPPAKPPQLRLVEHDH